jgi:hypothetical protein
MCSIIVFSGELQKFIYSYNAQKKRWWEIKKTKPGEAVSMKVINKLMSKQGCEWLR